MISTYLFMTRKCKNNLLKYLVILNEIELQLHITELIIWLKSTDILFNSKYLGE